MDRLHDAESRELDRMQRMYAEWDRRQQRRARVTRIFDAVLIVALVIDMWIGFHANVAVCPPCPTCSRRIDR